jgi:holo-[acyl-carrier protein] synthase
MIVGLGIDVCSIERMRRALERHGDRFFARICNDAERGDLEQTSDRAMTLAGRFAAKEAFAKALDGAPGVGWHDVEIRRGESGRPQMTLHGAAQTLATHAGAVRWHVSITHDAGIAAAVVILESL